MQGEVLISTSLNWSDISIQAALLPLCAGVIHSGSVTFSKIFAAGLWVFYTLIEILRLNVAIAKSLQGTKDLKHSP
jgi:hypothetical protein